MAEKSHYLTSAGGRPVASGCSCRERLSLSRAVVLCRKLPLIRYTSGTNSNQGLRLVRIQATGKTAQLAARGKSPAAFDRRCVPPDCVARRSNIPDILPPRALPGGRLAGLGASRDFCHGLLLFVGILSALAAMPPAMAQADERPNVVVVLVDDMRWDDFGAGGHPFVRTPSIDRVATEGAMFINGFTTTPLCSPARASILTGLYAHTNGIIDNTNRRGHGLNTFPRQLDETGYDTAFVGKWHMGTDGTPRPGFDTWVSLIGQGTNTDPEVYVGNERMTFEGHVTDVLTDHAVSFLEAARDEPFVLFFAQKAVHPGRGPRSGGRRLHCGGSASGHLRRRADRAAPKRRCAASGQARPDAEGRGLPPLGLDTSTTDATIRDRLEMVTGVDESVGRLLAALERTGDLDDTFFVVTSDHGYFYGEHGLNPQRRLAYEESARIPMVIRYPRLIEPGTRPEQLMLSIDLASTILELTGQEPEDPMQGASLVPILRGDDPEGWRTSLLIEHHSDPDSYLRNSPGPGRASEFVRVRGLGYKAVRTARYKYIQYTDLEGMDELYDLEADPYEMNNIIGAPEAAQLLEDMQAELARLLELTS